MARRRPRSPAQHHRVWRPRSARSRRWWDRDRSRAYFQSSQPGSTGDAEPAAEQRRSVAFVTRCTGRSHRRRAPAAIRLAGRRRRPALRTIDLARHASSFQVTFEVAGRQVAIVHVLGQVDRDQLVEPSLRRRIVRQLRLQLAAGEEALRGLAGRQVVQRARQGEQVAARLRLADDLLGRGVPLGVDLGLGDAAVLGRRGPGRGPCRSRSSDRRPVGQEHDVVRLHVAVDQRRRACRCMCASTSQIFAPHATTWSTGNGFVPGLSSRVEQVPARNELQHQVGGRPVLDQVVEPRHDRHVLRAPAGSRPRGGRSSGGWRTPSGRRRSSP